MDYCKIQFLQSRGKSDGKCHLCKAAFRTRLLNDSAKRLFLVRLTELQTVKEAAYQISRSVILVRKQGSTKPRQGEHMVCGQLEDREGLTPNI